MSANDRQVGGTHYKVGGEEHWDRVARLKLNYWQAAATKYIERAPHKNGKADIEKAMHYLEKYLEVWDSLHPPQPQQELSVDETRNSVGWLEEQNARDNYEVEGFAANGSELFKCRFCREEAWGLLASRSNVVHKRTCTLYPPLPCDPEKEPRFHPGHD